jgi:small nuclear ribonucleoprotein (snRNP)-like protein
MPKAALDRRIVPEQLLATLARQQARVEVWLFENTRYSLEGTLRGFDEHTNLVLVDTVEQWGSTAKHKRRTVALGTILLKGENVVLVRSLGMPTQRKEVRLGDGSMACTGLEMALAKMKKCAEAVVTIHSKQYADPATPESELPKSYHVKLCGFTNGKHGYEMSPQEKIEATRRHKEIGNKL